MHTARHLLTHIVSSLQAVLHALGNIKSLRRADLGGANLIALRRSSKQAHAAIINKTILDIVKLFSDDSVSCVPSTVFCAALHFPSSDAGGADLVRCTTRAASQCFAEYVRSDDLIETA